MIDRAPFPEPVEGQDPAEYARAVLAWTDDQPDASEGAPGDAGDEHWTRRGVRRVAPGGPGGPGRPRAPKRRGSDYLIPTPFMWLAISFVIVALSFLGSGWMLAAEKADKRVAAGEYADAQEELGELREYKKRAIRQFERNAESDAEILGYLNRAILDENELEALMNAQVLAVRQRRGLIEDEELLPEIYDAVRRMIDQFGGPLTEEAFDEAYEQRAAEQEAAAQEGDGDVRDDAPPASEEGSGG